MDRIIHRSARLACGVDEAFDLFTLSDSIQSWLVPVAEIEPVVGGKFELFWDPDDREFDSTIGCTITGLVPQRFLSFEWKGPRQFAAFMNAADPLTHVVVSFFPVEGGTDVHLVHSGWRGAPECEEARQWFERSWSMAFAELANRTKGPSIVQA